MDETQGVFGLYCSKADSIKCFRCHQTCLVAGLFMENGRTYEKPKGTVWAEVYYFCPCDTQHPVAVDEGLGKIQHIKVSRSELIRVAA